MPAVFVFSLLFVPVQAFAQETTVTDNGIILGERVSDEDVLRIKKLNEDSAAEYGEGMSVASGEEDLDDLFGSAEDSESAITTSTTESVRVDEKNKPIAFSGSLKAELGGNLWFTPWENTSPLASFRNVLKFTGRPSTDFYVTGSLLMDFQDMEDGHEMDVGLYELYFNYTLFGRVDVAAGKRDITWSLSRMLDTNILDDTREPVAKNRDDVVQEVLHKRDRTTKDSKFTVNVNIPIFSYGSIQGVAQYHLINDVEKLDVRNISVAGKIEGTVKKFSLAFLAMKWPDNMPDRERPNPALGLELVSTVLGKNSNLFVQGLAHMAPESNNRINRTRLTTGIYKYWQNPLMLGVAFEYQGVWDEEQYGKELTKWGDWQHYYAAQIAWSHFIFDKKWTFGLEWFHDTREEYGTILPVIKIEDIIKYTDFRLGVPIYYGTEKKFGLIFEVILNLDY